MIANGKFIRLSGGPGKASRPARTNIHDRVVVVGGGGTGATIAKFLRLWGAGGMDVTFIEPNRTDTFAPTTTRQHVAADANYGSSELSVRYGIRVLAGHIESIDPVSGVLTLADGTSLPFDRLVLAPGLELSRQPWAPIMGV